MSRAQEEFGRLDIAISNAAYSGREPFTEANMDEFRRSVDVTMWGAFYLVRAASQQMIKNGDPGSIVVVSSPHAFIPFPNAMAYNMSKAAIEQMAKTAATELVEHKIRINLFQPGWIDTPGERPLCHRGRVAGVSPQENPHGSAWNARGNCQGDRFSGRSSSRIHDRFNAAFRRWFLSAVEFQAVNSVGGGIWGAL